MTALEAIARFPFARHPNVERLQGVPDAFRFRSGDWRAAYHLDWQRHEMVVTHVEHRSRVYR